jgi:AcrR family transcriptional regulator
MTARSAPSKATRDAAGERILRAAAELFAERGFHNVSIRAIAVEAEVTHPLIYHYWGSKRALLAAVIASNQGKMRAVAAAGAEPRVLVTELVRENLAGSRQYLLTLTRAFLDGMPPADWPGGYPAIEAALGALTQASAHAGLEAADQRVADRRVREVLMAIVAMQTGWVLLEEQLLAIVGLGPADRDEARERLISSVEHVLDQALPPGAPGAR